MGCGGSKNQVASNEEKVTPPQVIPKQIEMKEEDDFQVIKPGKSMPVTKLDEMTNKTMSLNRTFEKNKDDSIEIKENLPVIEEFKISPVEISNEEPLKQKKEADIIEPYMKYQKARTLKDLNRENHPHEFDFSFIEEKKQDTPQTEILTDQLLKEITEIN